MKKAIMLIIGAALYLYCLQIGRDIAMAGLVEIQYLYTSADAQAAALDQSNR